MKPALCSVLSDSVIKNGQKIEIDEKYIRKINAKETAASPTLDAQNGSNSQPKNSSSMKPAVSGHHDDRELTWDILMEDWNDIIGDSDVRSIEIDAAESCESWTISSCDSCRRIEFCLSFYRLWIGHKVNGKMADSDLFRHEFLSDFLTALTIRDKHYSTAMMHNDFYHIKQFHINRNDGHNHSMDGEV